MGLGRDDSEVSGRRLSGPEGDVILGLRARARSRDSRATLGAQPVEPAAHVTSPSLLQGCLGCGSRPFSHCSIRANLREHDDHVPGESILHVQN